VFRGNEGSDYYGRYFFADYCSDKIWTLQNIDGTWVEELLGEFPGNSFSSFGVDLNGRLYLAGHTSGRVYRLNLP